MTSKNTPSTRLRKRGRRGSALILTMIMLILIVVLFSSFMIMAIYNHKNAKEGEALIQARLHCQTGLQIFYRDLSIQLSQPTLENLFPSSKSSQSNFFTPSSGDWADGFYWASVDTDTQGITDAIHTPLAGIDFLPSTALDGSIGWTHILDPGGSGAIVARLCYLVVDESGKVDPSAVVDTLYVEGTEQFTGTSPKDISLLPLFSSTSFAQKFQPKGTGLGTMPDTAFWFSYFHMLKTHPDALSGTNYKAVTRGKVFPFSGDIEAFNVYRDLGGNTMPLTKHRLDITAVDWDGMNNQLAMCVIDSDAPLYWAGSSARAVPSDANDKPTFGIPYLHYATEADIKERVLANLMDYCDTDSFPTTDYDITNTPNIAPNYVGLEKVPYINEIGFTAEIQWISGQYHLVITTYPELINCYNEDYTDDCKLLIKAEVSADDSVGLDASNPLNLEFAITDTILKRDYYAFSYGTGIHAETTKNVRQIPLTGSADWTDFAAGGGRSLKGIKITLNYARLVNAAGTRLLDYSFDEDHSPTYTLDTQSGEINAVSVEVNDPRYNLKPSEWTWSPTWVMGNVGTLGASNSALVCSPVGVDYDAEAYAVSSSTATPPNTPYPVALDVTTKPYLGVSTMFIRNKPMETLWELGCIHRGEAWRTLNLTVFNSAATETSGMADYASGDANILDEVKLGDQVKTLGRINVNTSYKEVVQALLANVTIGGTYEDSAVSGKTITQTVAGQIAQAGSAPVSGEWLFHNGSTGGKSSVTDVGEDPIASRGQLCLITKLIDGTAYTPSSSSDDLRQDTDMWKEEIIGKIAALTTTRSNFFTVIVVAQSIKDMPDGFQGGSLGTFDLGVDKIKAEQKTMSILHRDGFDNRFTVLRLEYLE